MIGGGDVSMTFDRKLDKEAQHVPYRQPDPPASKLGSLPLNPFGAFGAVVQRLQSRRLEICDFAGQGVVWGLQFRLLDFRGPSA